jgi:asparagine synthase (glutamine-hydrolysing)
MGQLAGIYYFDAHPIGEADPSGAFGGLLAASEEHLSTCFSNGLIMIGSNVAENYRRSGCLVSWEGRLDNCHDLFGPEGDADVTAALARRVCQAEGLAGIADLVGDWSLVSCNTRSRRVELACDYAGVRPLYYHVTRERAVWSSSLQCLSRWVGDSNIDEEYIADFLTRGSSANRSPIKGICPVPAGCTVSVTKGSVRVKRYWIPSGNQIRYNAEKDYEDRLNELFEQAVKTRLQGNDPVSAELSGGLDSSAVVCMANRLIAGRAVQAPRLLTFSYRAKDSTDETFRRTVEYFCGLESSYLDAGDCPFVTPDRTGGGAPTFWEPRLSELACRMQASGSRTLLTGRGGDLVMGNWFDGSEDVGKHLSAGNWRIALKAAAEWSLVQRQPVCSIVARAIQDTAPNWFQVLRVDRTNRSSDSLTPRLRQRSQARIQERVRELSSISAGPGRRRRILALNELLTSRALECPDQLQHLSYTHPFMHRPLVEYMLMVPNDIVYRPGEPRRLMRLAFQGLLPSKVLNRRSKTSYQSDFRAALKPLARTLLLCRGGIQVCERGYVEPKSLESRLNRFVNGLECSEPQLRNIVLLEFWLRNREGRCGDRAIQAAVDGNEPASPWSVLSARRTSSEPLQAPVQ